MHSNGTSTTSEALELAHVSILESSHPINRSAASQSDAWCAVDPSLRSGLERWDSM
jgi:hypothetical protein